MPNILQYTSTEAVIGALGLTEEDVESSMLLDQQIDKALQADLYEWVPDHSSVFSTGMQDGAAAADNHKANLLCLYSTWFCAHRVAKHMKLAFQQRLSDGKNDTRRFATLNLEALEKGTGSTASMYKKKLVKALNPAYQEPEFSLMSAVPPGYNPITGEQT